MSEAAARPCPSSQGRTQEGADGAKAPPPKLKKKIIIYSFKYGAFMFCSLYKEVFCLGSILWIYATTDFQKWTTKFATF